MPSTKTSEPAASGTPDAAPATVPPLRQRFVAAMGAVNPLVVSAGPKLAPTAG